MQEWSLYAASLYSYLDLIGNEEKTDRCIQTESWDQVVCALSFKVTAFQSSVVLLYKVEHGVGVITGSLHINKEAGYMMYRWVKESSFVGLCSSNLYMGTMFSL